MDPDEQGAKAAVGVVVRVEQAADGVADRRSAGEVGRMKEPAFSVLDVPGLDAPDVQSRHVGTARERGIQYAGEECRRGEAQVMARHMGARWRGEGCAELRSNSRVRGAIEVGQGVLIAERS